jgi:hypothetical protein
MARGDGCRRPRAGSEVTRAHPIGAPVASSTRRVTFVPAIEDAPSPRPEGLIVILDTAWTPGASDPPDVVSIRPYFAAALERHDLFKEALDLLDRWADAAGVADLLVVEGVTYWFRVRESLWHWVHERLLWRYTLAAIEAAEGFDEVSAPWTEEALIDIVHALGRTIAIQGQPASKDASVADRGQRSPNRYIPAALRRAVRQFRPRAETSAAVERRRRDAFLDERFERLSTLGGPRVLVLTLPSSYQRIGAAHAAGRQDPNLGSVISALGKAGLEPIVVGWGMNRSRDDEWPSVEHDDRLLPAYFVQSRWGRPEDTQRATAAIDAVLARLEALSGIPLDLDRLDMAPLLVRALRTTIERTINADVSELARVERLVQELDPGAILMTQEGHRTPWLIAGSRAGVPTFALQHGVLYAAHPGYADRRHPRLILPSRTFVFGEYERRALEGLAYRPDEVAVSGSPRLDLDAPAREVPRSDAERAKVRTELGVADGDRMLVVSTVHTPFVRRSHLVHMLEVLLGGPLPGVHVVFKQHPGERDDGPYRRLLIGLARAGGYESPPITLVKDIDLYRLLRAADAHLGQHSTVLTDAVMAGTCNLIAMVEPSGDILGYVPAGVARAVHDIADLRAALNEPRSPDPDARRAFIDDHFRPGDAGARIAAAIRSVVREPIATGASGTR